MNRWDDFTAQIFNDHLIMETTSKDVIAEIEDELKKDGTILKTKGDKIAEFKKSLSEQGVVELNGNYILSRFTIKQSMTRVKYNKLKGLAFQSMTSLLISDYLQSELLDTFDHIFVEVILDGKKVKDLDLLDLKSLIDIARSFIRIFEEKLAEEKKNNNNS